MRTETIASTRKCPFCAEPILVEAKKCKHCGEYLDPAAKPVFASSPSQHWSPGTAAVLSFFIPGLGQFYKGMFGSGISFMLLTPIGYLLFILPGLGLHLWAIIDAYRHVPPTVYQTMKLARSKVSPLPPTK